VERPVNRCTQVLHRNAWTPLHNRGKIVDMIASVGVLISAAALAAPAPRRSTPASAGAATVAMWGCWLALVFGDARVNGAVELVVLQLALDVGL
jgi:hypothetical protein